MASDLYKSRSTPVAGEGPDLLRAPGPAFFRSRSVPENDTEHFFAPRFMDDHGPHHYHAPSDSDTEVDEFDEDVAVADDEKDVESIDEVRGGIRNEVDVENRSAALVKLKTTRSRRSVKDEYLVSTSWLRLR